MIYDQPTETPMPAINYAGLSSLAPEPARYTAYGQPSNEGRALTGSYSGINQPSELPAERLARQRWEATHQATLEQTVWIRRTYWLVWGVIVPPALVALVWLLLDLLT